MTSLAQQLRQLALPQTQVLLGDDTRRASFLFDTKKAATIDRETFLSIGINGLQELENLDERFGDFELSLFSESSLSFERSIQTPEVNEQLDRNLDTFLLRLSPHLQLNPAQKALEWLIQRYRVHLNNVDTLMLSFLPYHESKLFVRMLKLLDLKAHRNSKWAWLQPVQKSDVHLSQLTLVNQCRTNPAALALITDMLPRFLQAFGGDDNIHTDYLRPVMNFYTATLVGVLNTGTINERIISAILPTLSRGFKSVILSYKASSYMVLGQMLNKCRLKNSLLDILMNAVCKNISPELAREAFCVLLVMFQTQDIDKISKKSFKHLSRISSVAALLASLSTTFQASRLLAALFQRLIPAAMKQTALDIISSGSSSSCSEESDTPAPQLINVVYDILANAVMDLSTVTLAARLILENFLAHCQGTEKEEVISRTKKLLRLFETRNPDALDAAVDSVMASAETDNDKQAVKEFLNLSVLSVHHRLAPDSLATLALCLHHRQSSVRVSAIKYLLDNLNTMEDMASVRETVLARLHDDSPAVIKVLLKQPERLWAVFSCQEELCSALLQKLRTIDTDVNRSNKLVSLLLGTFCQATSADLHRSEAVALSYLLVPHEGEGCAQFALQVLTSPLAASSKLLAHLAKEWLPKVKKCEAVGKSDVALSQLNQGLIHSLASAISGDEHKAGLIEVLYSHSDATPRQKALLYLLCEGCLVASQKQKDKGVVSKLILQLVTILKDAVFERKLAALRAPKKTEVTEDQSASLLIVMHALSRGHRLRLSWVLSAARRLIENISVPENFKDTIFWKFSGEDSVSDLWLQGLVALTDFLLKLSAESKIAEVTTALVDQLVRAFPSLESFLRYLSLLWTGVEGEDQGRALHLGLSHLQKLKGSEVNAILDSPAPVVPSLLALCTSPTDNVRTTSLKLLSVLSNGSSGQSTLYKSLVDKVLHFQQEIASDAAYLPTAVASAMKTKGGRRKGNQGDLVECLMKTVMDAEAPFIMAHGLLQATSKLDTIDTLEPLIPFMSGLLEKTAMDERQFSLLSQLLARFTVTIAPQLTSNSKALCTLVSALKNETKVGESASVQEIAVAQVTKEFFARMPNEASQRCMVGCLLDVLQTSRNTSVTTQLRKLFKHVSLPASLVADVLQDIPLQRNAPSSVKEGKRLKREQQAVEEESPFETSPWQRMTILLEILQTKKKIADGSKLVPVCFIILSRVLELESQGEAEYLKQLVLGVIYNLCHKHSPDTEPVKGSDLNMEAIVQCVRTSDNPHTHQQALLVLSVAAKVAPEQLLHSMMSVFTFMGANILRQDDSYSFHVITRILETVFPALVMACEDKADVQVTDMVTMVLRVFVDTYPHIPEHRKLMLFSTLLKVVGPEPYMWRLLLVFIEGVAVRTRAAASVADPALEIDSKPTGPIAQANADFLVKLVSEFSPLSCLQMAHLAMKYLSQLPADKTDESAPRVRCQPKSLVDATAEESEIFCLAYHTAKQLRHFKYATVYTLSHILSSRSFVSKLSHSLTEETMDGFRAMLESVLEYISQTSRLTERFATSPSAKFWRVLLNKCHDLLDNLVTLLPQDFFLSVVSGLMDSQVTSVQRKAMELLSTRLQHLQDVLQPASMAQLLEMVGKLQTSVQKMSEVASADSEDFVVTGQTALYTLKLLCRVLGSHNHTLFLQVLHQVCEVLASGKHSSAVLASAMLCAAEVVSCVRAHAIIHLPRIVPPVLSVLQAKDTLENDVLLLSCITSLHKIVEVLPHFLTPYLQDILSQLCHLHIVTADWATGGQKAVIVQRLKLTSQCLATGLPSRVFLPVVTSCYDRLLEAEKQESIESLLAILEQHINQMNREDLNSSYHQLLAFFLSALDFRITQHKEVKSSTVNKIEGAVVSTILSMVLKMSEATFRPMLLKIFEWATLQGAKRERVLVFYRLADSLVDKLRSLFLLFAAHFIKHAAQLLDLANTSKTDEGYFKKDKKERKVSQLLTYTLGCLHKCFVYDSENFINKERFDLLLQPLIDQVENFAGGEGAYVTRVKDRVVPAIANFAAAVHNDSLWKTLNYQLLLKTRSSREEVRLSALAVLEEFHKKLGEDYLPLLPETIPFLAELMEDDCEEVEKKCHTVIGEMEKTLGEPLQKYF